MFARNWGVFRRQDGKLVQRYFRKKNAEEIAGHYNIMCISLNYNVRFVVRKIEKGI